jgi:acyl carrier protein
MGLDTVELVLATEKHFDIEIPDRVAETLTTVGHLHGFVVAGLERAARPRDAAAVFTELRQLICDQAGIAPEQVVPQARFVQDLFMD